MRSSRAAVDDPSIAYLRDNFFHLHVPGPVIHTHKTHQSTTGRTHAHAACTRMARHTQTRRYLTVSLRPAMRTSVTTSVRSCRLRTTYRVPRLHSSSAARAACRARPATRHGCALATRHRAAVQNHCDRIEPPCHADVRRVTHVHRSSSGSTYPGPETIATQRNRIIAHA